MFTGYPVHTRVERHGNHRNRAAPRTASSLVFVSKGISNPDQTIEAGDVNISGVDFWHAVEFSRIGCSHDPAITTRPAGQLLYLSHPDPLVKSARRAYLGSAAQPVTAAEGVDLPS